jgi:hypothetical protein
VLRQPDALVEGSESSVVEAVPSTSAAVGTFAEIAQACKIFAKRTGAIPAMQLTLPSLMRPLQKSSD